LSKGRRRVIAVPWHSIHPILILRLSPAINTSISADSFAYLNSKVYTVDRSQPWAEAFIVTPDAKFAAIGSTDDIAQQARSSQLITVDLKGSFVMPGIHDSHVHTFHSGLHLLSNVFMDYSTNKSNLQPRMQEGFGACAFHNTYSDWIVGVLNEVEDYD
jgi:predicted amidohydrolase YtcJ